MEDCTDSLEGKGAVRWDRTTKVVVAVSLLILLGIAVYLSRVVLVPLVVGPMMAYILQPAVRLIKRVTRLRHGLAAEFSGPPPA